MVVAVLGTTISPYLFFWQATQEVEDSRAPARRRTRLRRHPAYVARAPARIKLDTIVGMGFSNLVALCIVVATAVTLNEHGITNIQTVGAGGRGAAAGRGRVRLRSSSRSASSAPACSPCRCSPARRPTR